MPLTELIFNVNIFFWLFPVLRQYRGGYFYYFLILAVSDPLALMLLYAFQINPMYLYLAVSFSALIAILFYRKRLKLIFILILVPVTLLFYTSTEDATLGVTFLHLVIVYNVIDIFIKEVFVHQKFTLYVVVLLLYELTILLKMFTLLIDFSTGIYFYYLTTAFDILIAVFFMKYNLVNSPTIKLAWE